MRREARPRAKYGGLHRAQFGTAFGPFRRPFQGPVHLRGSTEGRKEGHEGRTGEWTTRVVFSRVVEHIQRCTDFEGRPVPSPQTWSYLYYGLICLLPKTSSHTNFRYLFFPRNADLPGLISTTVLSFTTEKILPSQLQVVFFAECRFTRSHLFYGLKPDALELGTPLYIYILRSIYKVHKYHTSVEHCCVFPNPIFCELNMVDINVSRGVTIAAVAEPPPTRRSRIFKANRRRVNYPGWDVLVTACAFFEKKKNPATCPGDALDARRSVYIQYGWLPRSVRRGDLPCGWRRLVT